MLTTALTGLLVYWAQFLIINYFVVSIITSHAYSSTNFINLPRVLARIWWGVTYVYMPYKDWQLLYVSTTSNIPRNGAFLLRWGPYIKTTIISGIFSMVYLIRLG